MIDLLHLERAVTLCDGRQLEYQAITQALEATRWNRTAAAKKLGMSLRSLRYRLDKLGIVQCPRNDFLPLWGRGLGWGLQDLRLATEVALPNNNFCHIQTRQAGNKNCRSANINLD
jgi:hypothetical protein